MARTLTRRQICAATALPLVLAATVGRAQDGGVLEGDVVWRERIALPEGAVLETTLEDVSRMDVAAQVVAWSLAPAGPGSPARFRMALPPGVPDAKARYSLRARIVVRNRVWFMSTDHVPVPAPEGTGHTIPVQRTGGDMAWVPTGTWAATRIHGTPPADGVHVTLRFGADGRASGSGGCNRFTGSYGIDGDKLTFGPMASTEMACRPAAMAQEAAFHAVLRDTAGFALTVDGLELRDAAGVPLARLDRAQE